jgi:hypothetical protein
MQDLILFTDQIEAILLLGEHKTIKDIAQEILWSIGLVVINQKPAKEHTTDVILSQEEKRNIERREPFVIESTDPKGGEFYKLNKIFAHLVMRGNMRPYFIINIQNFSGQTHLAYMQFLRSISEKYNGNITFILSIQSSEMVLGRDGKPILNEKGKPFKPLDHDMPGTMTSRRRTMDVFGEDFYTNPDNYIANISDGGEKTRVANGGIYEQWSKALTPDGISFLETNILTAGTMWLLLPEQGRGKRLWLASDGKIQFGKIHLGGRPLKE